MISNFSLDFKNTAFVYKGMFTWTCVYFTAHRLLTEVISTFSNWKHPIKTSAWNVFANFKQIALYRLPFDKPG